jgi:nucleoside-diphosphate-sugar epimerase
MIALVTGANGFLGRALVARLLESGTASAVRCVVRSSPGARSLESSLAQRGLARAEIRTGTLWEPGFVAGALGGVDVVFHLAASARGAAADMFLNTVVASQKLLQGLLAAGGRPRIVLVSSFGVYGVAGLPSGALVDETTPLEPHPEWRDHYSHAKLRQERLFREVSEEHALPLVVLRPGSIYGPGGNALPARVGIRVPGVFLALGGSNPLPLSYVDNCAEALRIASTTDAAVGQAYNVLDDDLPTCREYLRLYKKQVRPIRTLGLPYSVTVGLSRTIEWYHRRSKGQLPAFLTPYRVASAWKRCRFDNRRLKSLGWRPLVGRAEGLRLTFEAERARAG